METDNLNNESDQLLPTQENKDVNSEQMPGSNNETQKGKNKKKHRSALIAAAAGRSAVQHAHSHIITNRPGDFAHSETNISYDN